jgi:signal transduction histidine kinase
MELKIWHKMIIGISIPSLIALLGGVLTYGYMNDAEKRQGFVLIADDLKENVLEVRRNEKNFLHYKKTEDLDNLYNAISALGNSISIISSQASQELGQDDFLQLNQMIATYRGTIDALNDNYLDEIRVTKDVMTQGDNMEAFAAQEKKIKELTTSFILHLRLLEKNYMLFRDRESFLKFDERLSILKKMTTVCASCKMYIEAVNSLVNSYGENDSMENDLREIGREMEKVTGRIAESERQMISSFITLTKRLLIAALVLLCTLGPFFVYKTANYIVAPIKRISDITKRISEGETDVRAPIKENDETSSLARSFNQMLDDMQLTHRSLEQSMELLTEKQAQLVDSEKRASLGLLVSGVAHELNNPLNNISIIAERMIEEESDSSDEEMKSFNNILSQCERAKHIVENLLDFARARKSTDMEKLDTVDVVKESFNLVANQLRINKINLEQDIPDMAILINGNRSKLEQIFVSVFTNAIQAMRETGTLSVSLKTGTDDRNVIIKINDTGPGIPEEDIKNIFEPFFTTKPVGKGTGLGLSVCKSLVMEHDGEINVESRIGKGTTFTIKFPLYEETA